MSLYIPIRRTNQGRMREKSLPQSNLCLPSKACSFPRWRDPYLASLEKKEKRNKPSESEDKDSKKR